VPAPVDVAAPAAADEAVGGVLARHGRIDILVNNAGIAGPNHATWDYPADAWAQVLAVNGGMYM